MPVHINLSDLCIPLCPDIHPTNVILARVGHSLGTTAKHDRNTASTNTSVGPYYIVPTHAELGKLRVTSNAQFVTSLLTVYHRLGLVFYTTDLSDDLHVYSVYFDS